MSIPMIDEVHQETTCCGADWWDEFFPVKTGAQEKRYFCSACQNRVFRDAALES